MFQNVVGEPEVIKDKCCGPFIDPKFVATLSFLGNIKFVFEATNSPPALERCHQIITFCISVICGLSLPAGKTSLAVPTLKNRTHFDECFTLSSAEAVETKEQKHVLSIFMIYLLFILKKKIYDRHVA